MYNNWSLIVNLPIEVCKRYFYKEELVVEAQPNTKMNTPRDTRWISRIERFVHESNVAYLPVTSIRRYSA